MQCTEVFLLHDSQLCTWQVIMICNTICEEAAILKLLVHCNYLSKLRFGSCVCGTISLSLPAGGGTGFVGRELIRLLRNKGHEVTLISRQPGPGKITWVKSQSNSKPVFLLTPTTLHDLPLCFRRGTWNHLDFHHVRVQSIWLERT